MANLDPPSQRVRVILHVGYHKTGTTSIQHGLDRVREALPVQGILYPKAGCPTYAKLGHHLLPWSLKKQPLAVPEFRGQREVFSDARRDELWCALRTEIDNSRCSVVILSSEEFDTLTDEEIAELGQRLAGYDLVPVMFVRNLADFVESMFRTSVLVHGTTDNAEDFVRSIRSRLDIAAFSKAVAALSADGALRLVDYDDPSRCANAIQAFLEAADLPRDLLKAQVERENESFAAFLIELLRHIQIEGAGEERFRWLVDRFGEMRFGPAAKRYRCLSADLNAKLLQRYAGEIATLTDFGHSGQLAPKLQTTAKAGSDEWLVDSVESALRAMTRESAPRLGPSSMTCEAIGGGTGGEISPRGATRNSSETAVMGWDSYVTRHREVAARIREQGVPADCLVFSVERYFGSDKVAVGGLADRIKGIAFLLVCAIATNRAFFIDWSTPSPLTNTYAPQDIDWRAPTSLITGRGEGRVLDWIDQGFSEKVTGAIESGRLEEEIFSGAPLVTINHNLCRFQYLASGPYAARLTEAGLDPANTAAMMRVIFKRLFEFRPTGAVAEKYGAFDDFRLQQPDVLAIQFRTGGDGGWTDPSMDNRSNAAKVAEAALVQARRMKKGTGFYVTTDSLATRDELVSLLSPHGEVFTFNVDPVHVDRSPGDLAARLSDFVSAEFQALAACNALVHGNGGFGTTAAWVGGRPAFHYATLLS